MEKLYYKLIRADMTHYGFKYKLGLNVDTNPFNDEYCNRGGLYACERIVYAAQYAPQDPDYISRVAKAVGNHAFVGKFIGDDSEYLNRMMKMAAESTARYLAVCRIPKDTQAVKYVCGHFINNVWKEFPIDNSGRYIYPFLCGKTTFWTQRTFINEHCPAEITKENPWQFPGPPKIKAHSLEIIKLIDLWDIENIGPGKRFNPLYRITSEITHLSSLIADFESLKSGCFMDVEELVPSTLGPEFPHGEEHPENMMVVKDLVEGKINGI